MSNNGMCGITGNLFGDDISMKVSIIIDEYRLNIYFMRSENY